MPQIVKLSKENGGSGSTLPLVVSFRGPSKPGVAGSNPAGRASFSESFEKTRFGHDAYNTHRFGSARDRRPDGNPADSRTVMGKITANDGGD